METLRKYLESVNAGETQWTTHPEADNVYWSAPRERQRATSFVVGVDDLLNRELVKTTPSGYEVFGPDGWIKIPANFDFTKIRRRIEDTLRKTATDTDLLRVAEALSVKIE